MLWGVKKEAIPTLFTVGGFSQTGKLSHNVLPINYSPTVRLLAPLDGSGDWLLENKYCAGACQLSWCGNIDRSRQHDQPLKAPS